MTIFPASIWLVGAGNMGGAMLRRWIASGADPANITVVDPWSANIPKGVRQAECMPQGAPEVLVLAVKPQQLDALPRVSTGLLFSILAGVEAETLAARFDARAVVRAMPNLPVSLGQGVVALYGPDADARARRIAETLATPLGLVEWIDDENLFHAVTALSGSGPGFVYRFIDALAEAGVAQGLPADQALRFAIATVGGASALAAASDESPATLADRVASPGGTTRAGLDVLDRADALKRLIGETIGAAAGRSAELAELARK